MTPCIPRCDPVECDVIDYHGDSLRLSSFGRRRRRSVAPQQQRRQRHSKSLENDENVMVAGSIRISDKFELGDKSSGSKPSTNWNDVARDDCSSMSYQPEGMNSFAFGIGATLFLIAQCILIAVWVCIYQRHKSAQNLASRDPQRDDCDESVAHTSGNFGMLFPLPPSMPVKTPPDAAPDFPDYNPYTADLFRRRQRDVTCDEQDFPSIVSVSSVASSVASVGTTMYTSLVSPKQSSKSKRPTSSSTSASASMWPKRNFVVGVFSSAESTNRAFEDDSIDQRKA